MMAEDCDGLGVNKSFPFKGGWNDHGEHDSNPTAGPPVVEHYGAGGMVRAVLESLHDFEHNWGAIRARRPFNRGNPGDREGY